jgi:hypothetical protein
MRFGTAWCRVPSRRINAAMRVDALTTLPI